MLSKKEFIIFLIFFLLYSLFSNYVGWNDDSRIFTTAALVDSKTFSINEFKDLTGDRAIFEGKYYSDKAPLSSIIGIPAYLFYRLANPPLSREQIDIGNRQYAFLVFLFDLLSAFFGAASIIVLYRTLLLLKCSNKAIFWLVIAYGFGTMVFSQSTVYNGHSIALLFLWVAIYQFFKISESRMLFAGFMLGLAFLTDYSIIIVLPCMLLYLIFLNKSTIKIITLFSFGFFIISSFLLLYNLFLFHNPFLLSYKYTDMSTLGYELTYTPLFFEYFPDNPNIIDLVKFRFFRDCYYEEFVVYDSTKKIISSRLTLGIDSTLINSSDKEWLYKYHYNTHIGNFSLYEKISKTQKNISGVIYSGFEISIKDNEESQEWLPIAFRIITNSTKTIIFRDSYSYTEDACTINTPFMITKILEENESSCAVNHYSRNNNKISESTFFITNLSTGKINGLNYVKRKVHLTNTREEALFGINKVIMLLFYPYRGLFFYSPFLILSFFGIFFMNKKKLKFAILSLAIFFSFLISNSLVGYWWGGSSYGPRFLVYALPFLIVLLSFLFVKTKKYTFLVYSLIVVSIIINLIGQQKLSLSQTNTYSINNRVRLNETYYDDLITMKGIDSPVISAYIPLFIKQGPSNVVLSRFGLNFGFFNIIIFLISILSLRRIILETKLKQK
jgi:hypothetical protein